MVGSGSVSPVLWCRAVPSFHDGLRPSVCDCLLSPYVTRVHLCVCVCLPGNPVGLSSATLTDLQGVRAGVVISNITALFSFMIFVAVAAGWWNSNLLQRALFDASSGVCARC